MILPMNLRLLVSWISPPPPPPTINQINGLVNQYSYYLVHHRSPTTPGRVSGPYDGSLKRNTLMATPKAIAKNYQPPPSTVTKRAPKTPLRQTLNDDEVEDDCFGRTPIQPIRKTPGPLITATPVVGLGSKKSSNVFQTIQVHQDDFDMNHENDAERGNDAGKEKVEPVAKVDLLENVANRIEPVAKVDSVIEPIAEDIIKPAPVIEKIVAENPAVDTLFDQAPAKVRTPIYERLYRQRPANKQIPAKRPAASSQAKVLQQRLQMMRNTRDSFSIKPVGPTKPRPLTVPKPFSFVNRPPPRKPNSASVAPLPAFRARPAPHPVPFRPVPSHKPATQQRPIQLALDRRLEARHRWEEAQRQREAQLNQQKQQAMEARKRQEASEIRSLRQSQVHRPLPMPRFGPVEMVKRSERPLTVPHSPKLATNRRIRLAK